MFLFNIVYIIFLNFCFVNFMKSMNRAFVVPIVIFEVSLDLEGKFGLQCELIFVRLCMHLVV